MVSIIFLGTNGWYDSSTGSTVCALIESKDYFIILDAGFGISKLDTYIPENISKQVFLFLSHFHLDHIVGLHTLNKFKLQKFKIFGPKGTKKALASIMKPPYTFDINKNLTYPLEIHELRQGWTKVPFNIEARYLKHVVPCMGYRFELEEKTIAYCTDTGVCQGLKKLAEGVDLLILECSYLSGERHPQWPHMNPEECGHIAKDCGVNKLVLTHFDAGRYMTIAKRKDAGRIARKSFKKIIIAKDGLRIIV